MSNGASADSSTAERRVDEARGRLDANLDALQQKLSPGQMVDEAMSYFRHGSGAEFGRNLTRSVREQPLPVALVGVGLAWLMFTGSGGQRHEGTSSNLGDRAHGAGEAMGERARQSADALRGGASSVSSTFSEGWQSCRIGRAVDRALARQCGLRDHGAARAAAALGRGLRRHGGRSPGEPVPDHRERAGADGRPGPGGTRAGRRSRREGEPGGGSGRRCSQGCRDGCRPRRAIVGKARERGLDVLARCHQHARAQCSHHREADLCLQLLTGPKPIEGSLARPVIGPVTGRKGKIEAMYNIFYIIGVVVVILFILSFLGLR